MAAYLLCDDSKWVAAMDDQLRLRFCLCRTAVTGCVTHVSIDNQQINSGARYLHNNGCESDIDKAGK